MIQASREGFIQLNDAAPSPRATGFDHFLPLSLTFDHRVVSGGKAARFLQALIEDLRRAASNRGHQWTISFALPTSSGR